MAAAFQRLKIVAEPGGAVALAAALWHGDSLRGDAVVVVVSGGNVDADMAWARRCPATPEARRKLIHCAIAATAGCTIPMRECRTGPRPNLCYRYVKALSWSTRPGRRGL
jgi:hypothetical protein